MKYRVWLPEQERIIEADSEDEAQDIFTSGDGIFDFLEVEPAEDVQPDPDASLRWVDYCSVTDVQFSPLNLPQFLVQAPRKGARH